ncbi:MAG: DUF2779 domain-containing protein [Deltaproteobacteria bacterium]|nr:DUF2779 domain-containing protein [Deltaproteobacteria bacterium]
MKTKPQLSKSLFMHGVQCLKSLYLHAYQKKDMDERSEHGQYIIETGTKVGELARQYFEDGFLIGESYFEHDLAVMRTAEKIKDRSARHIFEAAFTFDNIRTRVDVLRINSDGTVDLIEVKSSTQPKREHIPDLAIQAHVVKGLGYDVRTCSLMHLNPDYVYPGGGYDLKALFAISDVTEEVEKKMAEVPHLIGRMKKVLSEDTTPAIPIGPQCKNPHKCDFYGFCRIGLPEGHITMLPRISDKKLSLLRQKGIERISDIPVDFDLTPIQARIRDAVASGKIFKSSEISDLLSTLEFPLYFMDFETCNPALPIFPGSRPWQQIPFQLSVHRMDKSGKLDHREFLIEGMEDPRKEFVTTLLDTVRGEGTIVVYFEKFEKGILSSLAEHFPDFSVEIQNLNARIFDLYRLVCDHLYHPDFNGSFSIKKVLPALVPTLTYDGMEIAEGTGALLAYLKLRDPTINSTEKQALRKNLREYCKLDTLAMVEIYRALLE